MTYAKHTTHTDALDTLGSIIGPDEGRDAIHLAVFNAVAGVDMAPGQHVKLSEDKLTAVPAKPGQGVGIVDPFLLHYVDAGQRFWLVVYPRQISSLRHVWEHPAFQASSQVPVPHVAADKAASEQWLREYVKHSEWPSYEAMIEVATGGSWEFGDGDTISHEGEWILVLGRDAHSSIPPEFWDHVEKVTGQRCERAEYFSCSC